MNVNVQCCGLVLLLVMLYFYEKRRKLDLYTEIAFRHLFYTITINISLDILSIVALDYHGLIKEWIVEMVCKTYLVTIILTAFMGVFYVITDIYKKNKTFYITLYVYLALTILGIALVYILPVYKHYDEQNPYTYGPGVIATYVICILLLLFVVAVLCIKKKNMDIRRWEAVCIWMLLWIGAAIIQFMFNELLLVGFAGTIGVIIIYLKLENPEMNYDKSTGFFSQDAFLEYTGQLLKNDTAFSVLDIIFPSPLGSDELEYGEDEIGNEVIEFFNSLGDLFLFVKDEDEILLVIDEKQDYEVYINLIRNRFTYGWGMDGNIYITPEYIYMPRGNIAKNHKNLQQILRYSRMHCKSELDDGMIVISDKVIENMYQEKRIKSMIFDAIENDRIEVFYQPIFSIKESKFTSAEALVRIITEDGRVISPGTFIAIAEKNGIVMKIGDIVFEKVCAFIRDNAPAQYGLEYIEVNLSVVQCNYEHLGDSLINTMEKYDVKPGNINFEITESVFENKRDIILSNIRQLIDYGVSFSLDDFGTGQSNLNYIVDMPVEIVKFDKNMTNSYFENGKARYVMDAAMHMIQGLKLKIVSEGVETEKQFDTMKNLGINYIQGYYFSKPLPENYFLDYLKEHNLKNNSVND